MLQGRMYIFQCYALGIIFICFGKKIIVVMKTEIAAMVNMPEGGGILYKLCSCNEATTG